MKRSKEIEPKQVTASEAAAAVSDRALPPRRFEKLNRWLTLGANVGVVLGLIILIVEVRQSASLTRTEMEIGKNDLLVEIELSLAAPEMSAVWVKSIREPEKLSDAELRMVDSHLVAVMLQWSHMFHMQQSGLVSASHARQHILNTAQYYFGSRHARNWWKLQKTGWEGTPMMEVAGPIIEGLDETFLLRYLEASRVGEPAQDSGVSTEIENEARRFMEGYGEDLRSGNRAAIAARYDRSGAVQILDGDRTARSFDEIEALYRDQWAGPTSFEWRELSYDVLNPDSVVVTGEFDWGTSAGITPYSYTGILQRRHGEFWIRVEVESAMAVVPDAQP